MGLQFSWPRSPWQRESGLNTSAASEHVAKFHRSSLRYIYVAPGSTSVFAGASIGKISGQRRRDGQAGASLVR